MNIENCEYCHGKPLTERKPLMSNVMTNGIGNYTVFINSCNFLEDSVIGNSVPYSLHGVKINYCPICGRKLNK